MWKIRIIRKKPKQRVNQFKFETITAPQLDEQTPQQTIEIESFFYIERDPDLYSSLLKWAQDNNINSRQSYKNYRDSNITITLEGRTFSLPKLEALSSGTTYKFYRDVIQPQAENILTKEILFQILEITVHAMVFIRIIVEVISITIPLILIMLLELLNQQFGDFTLIHKMVLLIQ